MKNRTFACLFALSLVGILQNSAQASTAEIRPDDKAFMAESSRAGIAEVQLGKLAKKKSSDEQIRDFADRMITDHKKANKELKKIASKNNMTLPDEVNGNQQNVIDSLSKLEGSTFDRAYVDQMLADHKKVAESLKNEKTEDKNLQRWVETTLPVVEHHKDMADNLNKVF